MGEGSGFNWMYIVIAAACVLVVVAGALTARFLLSRKKEEVKEEPVVYVDDRKWVNALGGRNNIGNVEAKGSRLIVKLTDNSLINKDELHELGVSSIIASQDKVTLVLKDKAENIRNLLQ